MSVKAKEKASPNSIVGDPVSNGATLTIRANDTTPSTQTVSLPQGVNAKGKPFWSGDATKGFKYSDAKGEQGPVKGVRLKRSGSGTFALSAALSGKLGAVWVLPPNGHGCLRVPRNRRWRLLQREVHGWRDHQQDDQRIAQKKVTTEGSCAPSCSDGIQNQGAACTKNAFGGAFTGTTVQAQLHGEP